MQSSPSPEPTDNNRDSSPGGTPSPDHSEQPLASLTAPGRPERQSITQPTNPLAELKTFARELNTHYERLTDSIFRAKDHFNSLHITVEADRSHPDYPRFVTLNKIPNLHGVDPYRVIFPSNPYLGEHRRFMAAITLSLPNRLHHQAGAAPAEVRAGLAEPGEKPHIPPDQTVMVWLKFDEEHGCYTVRRPNTRGLGDYSDFHFADLEPHQKLLDNRWAWNGLERALQAVLPTGLIAEDRHRGGLRDILNDAIDIKSENSAHPLPSPYEMTAYLLDALAEISVTRGGFLWSKEIARPVRPPVTEITKEAEQFAAIHQTREAHHQMSELKKEGEQLLGLPISWATAQRVGELVERLEREAIKKTDPSRLARDLKKIVGWRLNKAGEPECIRDFYRTVDEIQKTAELGGSVSGPECTAALVKLELDLRALAAAG